MKQIIRFLGRRFAKQKTFSVLFSEALSEGIRETHKEMGYRFDDNNDKATSSKKTQVLRFSAKGASN
jgi:hypothetical protein